MSVIILVALLLVDVFILCVSLWIVLRILKFEDISIKDVGIISIISKFTMYASSFILMLLCYKPRNLLLGFVLLLKSITLITLFSTLLGIAAMILIIHDFFSVSLKRSILAAFLSPLLYVILNNFIIITAPLCTQFILGISGISSPFVIFTSHSMTHTGDQWKIWLEEHISKSEITKFPFQNGIEAGEIILLTSPNNIKLGDIILYNRNKEKKQKLIINQSTGIHVRVYNRNNRKEPILHRVVGIVHVKEWKISKIEGTLDCLDEEDFYETYIPYIQNCISNSDECPYPQYPQTGTFKFYITKGDNNRKSDQCPIQYAISLPVNEKQIIGKAVEIF